MNKLLLNFFVLLPLFCFSHFSYGEQENVILKMNRDLEEWSLEQLAKIQADPKSKKVKFVSDGCSGGLSAGWNSFADAFPDFKQHFGERPPWEYCCTSHDKDYWQGETEDGFNKRLKSDRILRQCVKDWGKNNSKRLAEKFNQSQATIESQVNATAELMYQTIRIGGKPCSFLPWRWGFGWPHCALK